MFAITPELLFRELNGSVHTGFAAIDSHAHLDNSRQNIPQGGL